MSALQATLPWYRHRWPWLLMSGPAIVVVAGIGTAIVAIRTSDGVVAEDYYKQGLAINRTLEREDRARAAGVTATLQLNEEATRVRVVLALHGPQPASLKLFLVHPTRTNADQAVVLSPTGARIFEGAIHPPAPGRWTLQLEDGAGAWRLQAGWNGRPGSVTLAPPPH